MATIKSYTDIYQSKKLAEILPLESADMYYHYNTSVVKNYHEDIPNVIQLDNHFVFFNDDVPCWSLASLLSVTRNYCTRFELTLRSNRKYNLFAMTDNYVYRSFNEYPDGIDEPIDVCVALIEKLHELKML